jgi:hypothetical protein
MSKRYWCPTCGDLESFVFLGIANAIRHRDGCSLREIPSVDPLDVPEETTWGESGGAGEVCVSQTAIPSMVIWTLGDSMTRRADFWAGFWWMTGDRTVENTDVVVAINYVAGVKR